MRGGTVGRGDRGRPTIAAAAAGGMVVVGVVAGLVAGLVVCLVVGLVAGLVVFSVGIGLATRLIPCALCRR